MKRKELGPYLEAEVDKWSAKSYEVLRQELKGGSHEVAEKGTEYHTEVVLLEDRHDYVHVMVSVSSERAPWNCFHPLSTSFLVYRDGRVDK